MREVILSRVDVDEQPMMKNNSRLRTGEHVIGRGPLLECQSKRVSRNHGLIRVSESEGVFLTSTHHNPCFYLSNKTKHTAIVKNGSTVQINNEDQIALLPDKYWYKVEIFDIVDEINNEASVPIKAIQLNNNRKRENKDVEPTSNKRLKENGDLDNVESSSSNSAFQNCDIELNMGPERDVDLSTIANIDYHSSSSNSRSESPDLLNNEFSTTVERTSEITTSEIVIKEVQNEVQIANNESTIEVRNIITQVADNISTENPLPANQNEASSDTVPQCENERVMEQDLDQLDQQNLNTLSELQPLPNSGCCSESNDEQQNIVTQKIDEVEQANNTATIKVRSLEELQNVQVEPEGDVSGIDNGLPIVVTDNVKIEVADNEIPVINNGIPVPDNGQPIVTDNIKIKVEDDVVIKVEDDDDTSSGVPQPSTSTQGRERCWFGNQCYRKNPQHRVQFSHPNDADYGDAQKKPMCAFGAQCYRRNPRHRHQYDHPAPPANKPPDANPKPKRPRRPKKKDTPSDEEDEDEYDLEDPFLDDGSSDEYQMPSESSDSDDELPDVKTDFRKPGV